MNRTLKAIAAASFALIAVAAQATLVTVTIPDEGVYTAYGSGSGASVTYGGVTFTQTSDGNLYNVSPGFSGDAPVVSAQQGSFASFLITLPTTANSISITYGIFFNNDNVNFTIGANTDTVFTTAAGDLYTTANVYSSGTVSPFTTVTASTAQNGLQISSITYNTTVPEPASWSLMIVGLAGVGYALRRRRTALA